MFIKESLYIVMLILSISLAAALTTMETSNVQVCGGTFDGANPCANAYDGSDSTYATAQSGGPTTYIVINETYLVPKNTYFINLTNVCNDQGAYLCDYYIIYTTGRSLLGTHQLTGTKDTLSNATDLTLLPKTPDDKYYNVSISYSGRWVSGDGNQLFYETKLVYNLSLNTSITSPLNNSYSSNQSNRYCFTPSNEEENIYGCYLYTNYTGSMQINVSNTSYITRNSENCFIWDSKKDSTYLWNIFCNLTTDYNATDFNNMTINIDSEMPILTVVKPTNLEIYNDTLPLNMTCTDSTVYQLNLTIRNETGLIFSMGNITTSGTALSLIYDLNISNYTRGRYYFNVTCSDGHTITSWNPGITETKISNGLKLSIGKSSIDISIKNIRGADIASISTIKEKDRLSFSLSFTDKFTTFDYVIKADKIVEYKSKYSGHIIIDDKYWFDTEPLIAEKIRIAGNTATITVRGDNNKEVLTESIGGLNFVSSLYIIYFKPYKSVAYSAEAFQTQYTNLSVKLLNISGISNNLNLIYNNTRYTANETLYDTDTNYTEYRFRIATPYYPAYTNKTFYFNYTYSNGLNGIIGNYTQMIKPIELYECYGTNVSILTLLFYEETSRYILNASGFLNFEISGLSLVNNSFSPFNFTHRHNFSICTSLQENIFVDAYITYTSDYGFTHRYYLTNETLSNITTYLYLYNFNTTTATSELRGIVRNTNNYQYFNDVYVRLYRFYPGENYWRLVQMDKSDEYGQIIFNVIESSTDYRLSFEYNNAIIYNTDTLKFLCTSGICSVTFSVSEMGTSESDIDMHPTYSYNNNTGIVTITWDDMSKSISNVTFIVTVNSPSESVNICYNNSNLYSGSMSCNVSGHYGEIYVYAKHYSSIDWFITEHFTKFLGTRLIDIPSFDEKDAAFWIGGITATLAIAGATISPIISLVMVIFSLIIVGFLQFNLMVTMAFVIPAIIVAIVISILMRQ